MAKSVNKVILLGNVGKDPEIRSTPWNDGGQPYTCDKRPVSGRGGELAGPDGVAHLVAFKRTAEIIRDYVKKGTQALH